MSIVSLLHIWGYSWEFSKLLHLLNSRIFYLFPGLNLRIAWHLAMPLIWGFCKEIFLPMLKMALAIFFFFAAITCKSLSNCLWIPGVSCMPTWKVLSCFHLSLRWYLFPEELMGVMPIATATLSTPTPPSTLPSFPGAAFLLVSPTFPKPQDV